MTRKLFALIAAVLMVGMVFGPGVVAGASAAGNDAGNDTTDLSVDVTQDGDGVTVAVTYNGSAAGGANVSVDGDYEGAGDYTAGEDGTVELPAPENNTTVTVTATYENETAETTANLTAADGDGDGNATDSFGFHVSAFVHELVEDDNETNESLGQRVSAYVTANNPGNASANAGPPENETQGPPEDKGPDSKETGQPDDAGPDGERGPPEDAGSNGPDANNGNGNDGKAKGKSG